MGVLRETQTVRPRAPCQSSRSARDRPYYAQARRKSFAIDPSYETRRLTRTSAKIWTSARRRSHHSAWPFLNITADDPSPPPKVKVIERPQMSEINPGVWDGLTPDQVRSFYRDEWDRFVKDPYAYRAPRAESYHDLCGEPAFSIRRHLVYLQSRCSSFA